MRSGPNLSTRCFSRWRTAWRPANDSKRKPKRRSCWQNAGKSSQALVQKSERKEKAERPPALYDLTTLQRDANRLLGYSAQQTLDYTQALYEKKLVTYPRTDSRYLTEEIWRRACPAWSWTRRQRSVSGVLFRSMQSRSSTTKRSATTTPFCRRRAWPGLTLSSLPAGEASILRLIAARLLAAVGEPYRYAETTVAVRVRRTRPSWLKAGRFWTRGGRLWSGPSLAIPPKRSRKLWRF